MLHFGLIGYPLEHSLSPPLHLAAFRSLDLDAEYRLYSIPPFPQGKQPLADLLERVLSGELQGLNVTIPHKQNVIPFLDDLSSAAGAIGAVNTIMFREGRLLGENTDAPGFWQDLCVRFPDRFSKKSLAGNCPQVLILGAGGSARAVLYALASEGWQVYVAARSLQQARQLAASFKSQSFCGKLDAISLTAQEIQPLLPNLALIVNATPLGMLPLVEGNPWPEELDFPSDAAVYDLVYNPATTEFVRQARSAGLMADTGLGMLVEQAALADELWTRRAPARALMFSAARHNLRVKPPRKNGSQTEINTPVS